MNCRTFKNRWGQVLTLTGLIFTGMVGAQDGEIDIEALEIRQGVRHLAGAESPFNGIALTRYPNGNISLKAIFRNGVQHGLETGWYQSGRLKHEIMYRLGQPQTLGSKWYEDKQEKEPGIVLCSENERLAGYCNKDTVDEASRFEPCIEGEECGEYESGSSFKSCAEGEC